MRNDSFLVLLFESSLLFPVVAERCEQLAHVLLFLQIQSVIRTFLLTLHIYAI